jgi:hypothetical protein
MNLHRQAVLSLLLGACLGACGSDDSSSSSSSGTSSSSGGSQSSNGGAAGIPDLEPGGSNIHYPPVTGGSSGASGGAGGVRDGGNGASGSVGLSDASRDATLSGVLASPECNAFCQKAQDMCMAKCDRVFWCGPRVSGQCDAATRAYLQCVLDTAKWTCVGNGLMLDHRCAPDLAICM